MNLNSYDLGNKFLAVVSKTVVRDLFDEVASMGMMTSSKQWVYVIPDTNNGDTDAVEVLNSAVDGNNVAFVYNASQTSSATCQVRKSTGEISQTAKKKSAHFFQGDSALCTIEEFLRAFVDVMQDKTVRDAEKYFDMTVEEYDLVKPSRKEEMLSVAAAFRTYLVDKGKCGRCTEWLMDAAEIGDGGSASRLGVGVWWPVVGIRASDHLLPHVTGGLRGRTITVASTHVKLSFFYIDQNKSITHLDCAVPSVDHP